MDNNKPLIAVIGNTSSKNAGTLQEAITAILKNRFEYKNIPSFNFLNISQQQFVEESLETPDTRNLNHYKYFQNEAKEAIGYSLTPKSKELLKTKIPSNKVKRYQGNS